MKNVCTIFKTRILTAVTIQELLALELDILTPSPLLEIRLKDSARDPSATLQQALTSLYHQIESGNRVLKLTIVECEALLQLEDIVLWDTGSATGKKIDSIEEREDTVCYRALPAPESPYWSRRAQRSYHLICIEQPGISVIDVEDQVFYVYTMKRRQFTSECATKMVFAQTGSLIFEM